MLKPCAIVLLIWFVYKRRVKRWRMRDLQVSCEMRSEEMRMRKPGEPCPVASIVEPLYNNM
eukprot:1338777-Amorphochlora_amoeboformis.AAC.1